jgi:ABC-type multidrug transport system ATPase subunit
MPGPDRTPALEVRGLTKSFRGKRAVDGAAFAVARGDVVGFLGPNGAGKTTVMKMVMGLLPPDAGQITLLGAADGAARLRIGYLQEKPRLYPDMTARAYLEFFARLHGVAAPARRAAEVLERVTLTAAADRALGSFSRGMQQRACLARVMLHEPEFLLLDEPTLGLDPGGVADMRAIFLEMKGQGVTLLFSSHQLAEMERVCDSVIFMQRGRVIAAGRPADLLPPAEGAVSVELHEPVAEWLAAIAALPGVVHARVSGAHRAELILSGAGGRDARACLSRALIGLGLTVLSVGGAAPTLEDLFLGLAAREAAPHH